MNELVFIPTLTLFLISIILFYYYANNLYMNNKHSLQLTNFLGINRGAKKEKFIKFSDILRSLSKKDKTMLSTTQHENQEFFQNNMHITVDDDDVQGLSIVLNNKNNNRIMPPSEYDIEFHTKQLQPSPLNCDIIGLVIKSRLLGITLSGVRIDTLTIEGDIRHIHIVNCWIGDIEFKNIGNEDIPSLSISHSNIRNINLNKGKVSNVSIDNSTLDSFQVPFNYDNIPIEGDISFIHTSLTNVTNDYSADNIHNLRNLRNILDKHPNQKASRYVLGFEKRIQRKTLKGTSRIIDYLYDSFSFYNNNPERILGYIGFMLLIMYSFLLVSNINLTVDKKSININTEWFLYLKSSFGFILQSIITPLSTIKGDGYFCLESIEYRFIYTLLSILILLLLALYIFGLKRKYQD